jgi:hypothetical protein
MIGGIAGLGMLITYLGYAWDGESDGTNFFNGGVLQVLVVLGVVTVVGIFFFPRTIGMMFTPMFIATPLAFLIALFRHGLLASFWILGLGAMAWLITFLIGNLRPEST